MPLPQGGTMQWPPKVWDPAFKLMGLHAAWYSGSSGALAQVYGRTTHSVSRSKLRWRFWERVDEHSETQPSQKLHVPLAGDLASVSAALLFSEAPTIYIPEASEEQPVAGAKAAQERLDKLLSESQFIDTLIHAGESASALGGVYIMVNWDVEVADYPFATVVHADMVVPEFRYGRLMAATIWRVVHEENTKVWRHLERHEPGLIEHGLYEGTQGTLGQRRSLEAQPDTAGLDDEVRLPAAMRDRLIIEYIPNAQPNRIFRTGPASALGRSDYTGVEGLLDALDEVYTSWLRDIRLGKSRIIVPEDFLDVRNKELVFDHDREVFTPLAGDPLNSEGNKITPQQFAIRYEEHLSTALELIDRIVTHAGYAPQTFGLKIEGRAESGVALRVRERKSLMTQQSKRRAWEPRLPNVLHNMLIIDREIFGRRTTPVDFVPAVELADSIQPDPVDLASTTAELRRAESASTRTLVRMLHPGWTATEVDEEVERIHSETGRFVEDPMQAGVVP